MFLSRCPSCGRNWADLGESTDEPVIRKATVALKHLQDILTGELKAPLGFTPAIEIKPGAIPGEHKGTLV